MSGYGGGGYGASRFDSFKPAGSTMPRPAGSARRSARRSRIFDGFVPMRAPNSKAKPASKWRCCHFVTSP